ncbi:HET-domain-containing protein [Annulohypoxylon moriforme]|nr:HET-domain-containing protein [Annulohypoxylon moriforme]
MRIMTLKKMQLCSYCDQLNFSQLLDDDLPQDVLYHKSIEALQRSASSCSLCKLFYNDIATRFQIKSGDSGLQVGELRLKEIEQSLLHGSQLILRGRMYDENEVQLIGFKLRFDSPKLPKPLQSSWYYSLYLDDSIAELDSNIGNIIVGRKVGAPENATPMIKSWIDNCEKNHSKCQRSDGNLPTRLVDVGSGGDEPRLRITSGKTGRYLALSHCWGPNPDAVIRTKLATLEEHQNCIPLARLSKTFHSAVMITRSLGIQYLWIDSLCIIQDDVSDWERESAKMGDIYSSAFATIAASASPDSSTGCFIPRDNSTHAGVKFSVGRSRPRRYAEVLVRPQTCGFQNLKESPLQRRAWVTQERILSRRIIHYDVDQILWECRESQQSEDRVPPEAYQIQETELWKGFRVSYQSKNGRPGGDFVWDWYEMVKDYTGRVLTKRNDKLPAISGIASQMEIRTGESYVAGMWRSHLHTGILWQRSLENWLVQPPEEDGYRAPSWSWSALDGKIEMWSNTNEDDFECAAEDIQAEVIPLGADPRGRLASGVMTLTARIKAVDPRINPSSSEYNKAFVLTRVEDEPGDIVCDKGKAIGNAIFDKAYESSGPLYCLEVIRRSAWRHRWYGLVLEPTGRDLEFRRVGYARDIGDSLHPAYGEWFKGAKKERISII